MKQKVTDLIEQIEQHQLRFALHHFDSGAMILDLWIQSDFYSIQMMNNRFGWSKIDSESGFSSIPDSGYQDWDIFKNEFDKIVGT